MILGGMGNGLLLSYGAGSGIMLYIKGAKILGTRSLRQQFCMVVPDEGGLDERYQKRNSHIKKTVPYTHVQCTPLERNMLKVFIIPHSCMSADVLVPAW
jgi:hypothetical protein